MLFLQLKLSILNWNEKKVDPYGWWPTCKSQLHQKFRNKLFCHNNHLCWNSLFFSPFPVQNYTYFFDLEEESWCDDQFSLKLFVWNLKKGRIFQKLSLEMEQHKLPICHPLLYCALKIINHSMQRLGCGEIWGTQILL